MFAIGLNISLCLQLALVLMWQGGASKAAPGKVQAALKGPQRNGECTAEAYVISRALSSAVDRQPCVPHFQPAFLYAANVFEHSHCVRSVSLSLSLSPLLPLSLSLSKRWSDGGQLDWRGMLHALVRAPPRSARLCRSFGKPCTTPFPHASDMLTGVTHVGAIIHHGWTFLFLVEEGQQRRRNCVARGR